MSIPRIAQHSHHLPPLADQSSLNGLDTRNKITSRARTEEEAVFEDEMAGHRDRFSVRHTLIEGRESTIRGKEEGGRERQRMPLKGLEGLERDVPESLVDQLFPKLKVVRDLPQ